MMPLRAAVDGKDVIAPFLSSDEWERLRTAVKLKQKELRLPCCQKRGYLRTSKLGTNHFVHARTDQCRWASETVEHLKAKTEITLVCKKLGYDVTTEAIGNGWKADVLGIKGTARIAFEIQWSRQTFDETMRRQERYRRDRIRGCWLFRFPPKGMEKPRRDLPLFILSTEPDQKDICFKVDMWPPVNGQEPHLPYNLSDFIGALLEGKVKFCEQFTANRQQYLRVASIERECQNHYCPVKFRSTAISS